MRLSKVALNAKPSATLSLDSKAKRLMSEGVDVVNFTVGEPDFDTPDNIKQAAHRAIQAGFTKYTPAAGTAELRQAIARKLERENGLRYSPEQILVSNGAKHVLYQIMLALLDPGDEAILVAPYWVSYADQALMCGAQPVIVPAMERPDMKPTPQMLRQAMSERSRLLVLNSPCNPTGVVLSRAELQALVDVALERDLWIISDEVYEHFMYDGAQRCSPAAFSERAYQRVITVNAVSKTYAMTGWRIGYAAGPAEVIRAAATLQSNMTSGPNSIAQKAAVEALNGPQESVEEMRRAFLERRDLLVKGLNELPGVRCPMPQGAFYVFPDCRALLGRTYRGRRVQTDLELCEALLEQARVAVVPGSAFGAEGYLRFSYATSTQNIVKGLERLRIFVSEADT